MAEFKYKKTMLVGLRGEPGPKGDPGAVALVEQTTGDSTENVMSQKATTLALNKKVDTISSGPFNSVYIAKANGAGQGTVYAANPLLGMDGQLPAYQNRRIKTATPEAADDCVNKGYVDEKIDFIEAVIGDTIIADTETEDTYTLRETAGGLDIINGVKTSVKKIQGATASSLNLLPTRTGKTENGITSTTNSDGSVTLNGTATAVVGLYLSTDLKLGAGNYFLSGCPAGGGVSTYNLQYNVLKNGAWSRAVINRSTAGVADTIAEDETIGGCFIWVATGQTLDNLTFKPMLVRGSTLTPYTPYFPDLKSANFKGIESTGKNLFNPALYDCVKINDDGTISTTKYVLGAGTVATVFKGEPNTTYTMILYDENKEAWAAANPLGISAYANGTWMNTNSAFGSFTTDENGETELRVGSGTYNSIGRYKLYIAIYKGKYNWSQVIAYEPYTVDSSFSLDTAVVLGAWDFIDVANKKLKRQTGVITQETEFTAEELANYADYVLSADGKTLAYKLPEATEEDINIPDGYVAYRGGLENVVQGSIDGEDYDNAESGAETTITQNYYVKVGE